MPGQGQLAPTPRRWTVAEFHRLWELGVFEGCRPMLLNGVICERPIPSPVQCAGIGLADEGLRAVFPRPAFWIRQNMPLVLGPCTDPVPNLAVVTGSVRELAETHPTTSLLGVEVSDGLVAVDTGEKAELYAAAGIADYWVVDLNNRVLIVHRDPRPDSARQSGSSDGTVRTLTPGQAVSPLAAPQATVGVGDLLP